MYSMAGKTGHGLSNVEYPRRRFEHFLWALLVLFLSLALGVGAVGFFYARHEKTSRRRAAEKILARRLSHISDRVAGWVQSVEKRALKAAEESGGAAALLESVSSGDVSEVERRLREIAEVGQFDCAALFDGSGRLSAAGSVRGGLPEIHATPPEHALAAVAAGRTHAVWLPAAHRSGELAVQIWCPARSEPAGAIVFVLLGQRHGFPDMACEDVLGTEAEVRLCAGSEKGIAIWPAGGVLSRFTDAGKMIMESPEGSAQFQIEESDGKARTFITAWRQSLGAEWTVAASVAADKLEAPFVHAALIAGSIVLVLVLSAVLAVVVLAWLRNTEVMERRLAAEGELGRSLEQLHAANAMLGAVCGVNHLITHEKDVRIVLDRACAALAATPVFAAACAVVFGPRDRLVIERYAAGQQRLVDNLMQGKKPEQSDWLRLAADSQDPVEIPSVELGDAGGCRAYAVAMRAAGKVYGVLVGWLKPSVVGEEPLSYFQTVAGDLAFAMYGAEVERERRRIEEQSVQEAEETRRRNEELERFRRLALGRELRMIEIKRQVNELSRRLGEQPPYPGVLRPDEQETGGSGNEGKDKNSCC